MNAFLRLVGPALLICLCACGGSLPSTDQSIVPVGFITEPGCLDHALVRVSYSDRPLMCSVVESSGNSPREMTCASLGEYLRKNLNPPKGAIVGVVSAGAPSLDAMAALFDGLGSHGFEYGGTECWVSQPAPSDR